MEKYVCLIVLGALAVSCEKKSQSNQPRDLSNKPEELVYFEAFKTQSVFYDSIPSDTPIDPNSSTMVTSLIDQANQGFLISVKEWTTSVFYADESTPRSDVKITASWAPKSYFIDVPIPDFAEPDPSEDGHMVIIDQALGCVYDFWEMKYNNGWKAGWGNALPLESDGIFPTGLSARGSGFELMQGMIWPHELESGVIDHALIFSYNHTKAGGPVSPATESDGTSNNAWAIPEGARIRLNPDLNLSTLGLNSYEMTIAICLQKYGMYCADDGGGISLYAINPLSSKINPYVDIWGDETYVDLSKIPVDQFRIMELGAQTNTEATLSNNSCTSFID